MRLSIVIAAWNGPASLERCLRSLAAQADGNEILVIANFDAPLSSQFPSVRYIPMPPGTTVPVLRAEGIRQSGGEIVALAEDHCTFNANWCAELLKAHELPYSVIGGAVENGDSRSALSWAVYFYDYSRFMLPLNAAPVPALSGNNVSYKRAALREVEATFREGFFEPFTHGELVRIGHPLYLAPRVVVYHQKHYRTREAARQAYHLARHFAATRVRQASPAKRAAFVLGSLALPLVLPARIVVRTVRRRRLAGELLRSMPYLTLLTTSWSWGEFCGYLAGTGSSAREWK